MHRKRCFLVSLIVIFLTIFFAPLPATAKIFEDLQDLITFLNQKGELVVIDKAVSSEFEAAAIQSKVLNETGKAVLFTNIDGKGKRCSGISILPAKCLVTCSMCSRRNSSTKYFLSRMQRDSPSSS